MGGSERRPSSVDQLTLGAPAKRRAAQYLFLDMATTVGWCAGSGRGLPAVGHVTLPSPNDGYRGRMFLAFHGFLTAKIEALQVGGSTVVLGFEQPIMPKPFFKGGKIIMPTNINVTLVLQGLAAVAQLVAEQMGVTYRRYDVSAIKKELAGFGGADKDDMMFVARKVGLTIDVHDEADAFGGYLLMLREFNKAASADFDRLVWSSRGGLI